MSEGPVQPAAPNLGLVPATIWTTDDRLVLTSVGGAHASARLRAHVGRTVQEFFATDDESYLAIAAHRRVLEGDSIEYELEYDGGLFATHLEPIRGAGGSVEGVIGVDIEVTNTHRMSADLRIVERGFLRAVERLGLVTYEHIREPWETTYISPLVERLLGYTPEQIAEPGFTQHLIHPDDLERVEAEVARSIALLTPLTLEYRMKAADGTYRWLLDEATPIEKRDGRPGVTVQGVLVDITEQKQLEESLQQAQKMEAVGRLAGGVAHDFNNILTAITGYTDSLLARTPRGTLEHADLLEISAAASRAAALTQQLLAFSRRQVSSQVTVDVAELVKQLDSMLRRLIGEDVVLEVRSPGEPVPVRVGTGQLEQVILNLVVNAREAMPEGGRLTIDVRAPAADGRASLVVRDTGAGIPPELRARIFEPFFTTKAEGTGLGLSTVYGIVGQLGGEIACESVPGRTEFRVSVPTTRIDVPAPRERVDDGVLAGGRELVLVVEDDDGIRRLLRRTLEDAGYTVIDASNGSAALELLAGDPTTPVDLLVTDVVMPGLSGTETADRAAELRPGLRVLFMSGYTDDALARHRLRHANFLPKPFSPATLIGTVRSVLDN